MDLNIKLLEELTSKFGPSSKEDIVREFITNEIQDYVDEIQVDSLGNLIARKKGPGKKIMISAHMDQIGLMVTHIDEKGFIRFTNIGGISPHISLGQQVIFENSTKGIIYNEHIDDIGKLKLENLFIDIGASSREEAEKKVNIGDICIYDSMFIDHGNLITSRYLDDRVGCYIAIEALKEIDNNENDLYFVFSVQEEVGLRGAKTAAYGINPDLGIAIDVTSNGDTPKAKPFEIYLGKGVGIKLKDNSMITSPKVRDMMIDICVENNIDYQLEILEFGGTDGGAMQASRSGVLSGVISVPTRYVHSPVETCSKADILSSIKLLKEILVRSVEI